jgi:hypothetical protein
MHDTIGQEQAKSFCGQGLCQTVGKVAHPLDLDRAHDFCYYGLPEFVVRDRHMFPLQKTFLDRAILDHSKMSP